MRSDGRSRWQIQLALPNTDQIEEVLSTQSSGNSATWRLEHICTRDPQKPRSEFALHFKQDADDSIRRSAGLGGCPFAQDVLVGNLPTEILIAELRRCGAMLPRSQGSMDLDRGEPRDFEPLWFSCAMRTAHDVSLEERT